MIRPKTVIHTSIKIAKALWTKDSRPARTPGLRPAVSYSTPEYLVASPLPVMELVPAPEPELAPPPPPSPDNPIPSISDLLPDESVTAGLPHYTLTLSGSGFMTESLASVNGQARTVIVTGPNQLSMLVTAQDLASPGTLSIQVVNPLPGGGASDPVSFFVKNPIRIDFSWNDLAQATIDWLLTSMWLLGVPNGTINLGGDSNSAPSDLGRKYVTLLQENGWVVIVN